MAPMFSQMLRVLIFFGVAVVLLLAGSATADIVATETDSLPPLPDQMDEEFVATLDARNCTDLNAYAYREIPRYVLADRPDLMYEFILYWENRCLGGEPLFRARILGSLWDAAFDEGLYDEDVLDQLIDRYDPPVESKYPDLRKGYDAFTASFADQLLPHVPRQSLEEFFCLFYAGKTDEAWKLLESEALEDTWLRFYYDQEMEFLNRSKAVPVYALTGGGWWPRGNVAFVGDKPLAGILAGVRWPDWMLRVTAEWRIGRSDEPYWVNEGVVQGRSDRFNATLIGAEFGRILVKKGRSNLDVFAGAGVDVVAPFKDEELFLGALNLNVGAGYRIFLGKTQRVVLGLDVRHEWIGERNEKTQSMSGRAWSLRFSLGFAAKKDDARRLKGLGR